MQLFKCPKIPDTASLSLTKEACARYYYLSNKQALASQYRYMAIFYYCQTCEIGKKNLKKIGGKLKNIKKQSKICLLYQVAPDKCTNEKYNGTFVRKRKQFNAAWSNKMYCSEQCGIIYNQLKEKGLLK